MGSDRGMLTRTTTALLSDLRDPHNEDVWHEFDARFRPVLVAISRRLGLGAEDAADVAQESLMRFVQSYRDGQYDRERGRLRSWMIGITKNCAREVARRHAVRRERHGLSAALELAGDADLETVWDQEVERGVLSQSVELLRSETRSDPRTVQAFEAVAFHGRLPAEVAVELDMGTNDVYVAKHRCLKRLRDLVSELRESYELPQRS